MSTLLTLGWFSHYKYRHDFDPYISRRFNIPCEILELFLVWVRTVCLQISTEDICTVLCLLLFLNCHVCFGQFCCLHLWFNTKDVFTKLFPASFVFYLCFNAQSSDKFVLAAIILISFFFLADFCVIMSQPFHCLFLFVLCEHFSFPISISLLCSYLFQWLLSFYHLLYYYKQ